MFSERTPNMPKLLPIHHPRPCPARRNNTVHLPASLNAALALLRPNSMQGAYTIHLRTMSDLHNSYTNCK
jgi:hypothetical protein